MFHLMILIASLGTPYFSDLGAPTTEDCMVPNVIAKNMLYNSVSCLQVVLFNMNKFDLS
jgi:hypothetical protein